MSDSRQRMNDLLDAYVECDLDGSQRSALNELLRTDSEARRTYAEYFAVHAALAWDAVDRVDLNRGLSQATRQGLPPAGPAASGKVPVQPVGAGEHGRQQPPTGNLASLIAGDLQGFGLDPLSAMGESRSPVLGFLGTVARLSTSWLAAPRILAALIAGGLITYFGGLVISIAITRALSSGHESKGTVLMGTAGEQAQLRTAKSAVSPPVDVGSLTTNDKTRWSRPSPASQDRGVRVGETYDLASGRAYIRLAVGVQLMIEGPARWEFASEERISLASGRLVAQVPRVAVGFTVATPTAEIVDLGTEFGVVVDEEKTTDVVVFRGQVSVKPQAPASTVPGAFIERPATLLWAGQSNRVSALGVLTSIKPSEFGSSVGEASSIRRERKPNVGKFTSGVIAGPGDVNQGPFVVASDLGAVPGDGPTIIGAGTFTANAGSYFSGKDYGVGAVGILGDSGLSSLLHSQRFNPTLSADIPVTAGKQYELQLLFFEPGGLTFPRPMTITAEDDTLAGYSIAASGSVCSWVKYAFTATDSTLNVELSVTVDNSTLSGFSLMEVTPVVAQPEDK